MWGLDWKDLGLLISSEEGIQKQNQENQENQENFNEHEKNKSKTETQKIETEEAKKQKISEIINSTITEKEITNEIKNFLVNEIIKHNSGEIILRKIKSDIEEIISKINQLENLTEENIKKIIFECYEPKYEHLNAKNDLEEDKLGITQKKNNFTEKLTTSIKENNIDIMSYYGKVKEYYEKLNPKYKENTQEKLNKKKESLSKDTKEKLEKAGGEEAIDQYVNFLCSRDKINEEKELPKDPNVKEFLDSLDTFEQQLWIESNKTVWGYPTSFNANKEDIYNSTKNIQDYASKENFKELSEIKYMWDLNRKDCIDLINKYMNVDFIRKNIEWHEDINNCFKKIEENQELLKKDPNEYDEEEKKTIQTVAAAIKYSLTEDISAQIRNSITFAPIASIMQYLDWDRSLWYTSIAEQLEQSKGKEKQDEDNWTFTIQWEVDWSPICFYYEFWKEQAQLKCEDYLHYNKDENSIKLYKEWKDSKTNLNIPIPSKEDLSKIFANIWEDEYRKIFFESAPEEYNQKVAELISSKIESWFPNNPMVWIRIRRHAEKNLAVGKFKNTLIPDSLENEISEKLWSAENNDLKQLFQYLDNTTEQATGSDLQRLRNALNKLDWFLNVPDEEFTKDRTTDKTLIKLFKDLSEGTDNDSNDKNINERENSIINFFKLCYKKENSNNSTTGEWETLGMIDIDAFEECLELFEKPDKKPEEAKSNILKENRKIKNEELKNQEAITGVEKELDDAYPPKEEENPDPEESST